MTRPVVLLSCGGYRSGSTYAYNLLGEHAERTNRGRRIGYLEPTQVPQLEALWSVVEALGVAVAKTHQSPAIPEGSDSWTGLLADGRVLAVCTVRDWRDVLHSMSRMFGETPEQVLASRRWRVNVDNLRWWLGHGALEVRYDVLRARPGELLTRVAAELGLPDDQDADQDAAQAAVTAAAVPAAAVPAAEAAGGPGAGSAPHPGEVETAGPRRAGGEDARTLLHPRHVALPEGGGWRAWDGERLARLRAALEPLMAEFGQAWSQADGSLGVPSKPESARPAARVGSAEPASVPTGSEAPVISARVPGSADGAVGVLAPGPS